MRNGGKEKMVVKPKKHNECNMESFIELPVYSIKNDSNDYPHFLFYYKGEWLRKSVKHFENDTKSAIH